MAKFEEVYAVNVNDKTEKKGNLTYLSWANAWAEFKKFYPKATYTIDKFDGTYCTGNEKIGYMVRTEVFADDLVYEMWLPVMDMRNNSILQPKMTEINKTIMRCLTKNLAMFGLGLYIYAGEDLPETENEDNVGEEPKKDEKTRSIKKPAEKPKTTPKKDEKVKTFEPLTRAELVKVWGVTTPEKTIDWLEGQLGKELAKFTQEDTEWARGQLEIGKKKKAARQSKLDKIDGEVPFPMGE